jgi:hypothetical protein
MPHWREPEETASAVARTFEIEDDPTVSVLAVRHQWEEDYR